MFGSVSMVAREWRRNIMKLSSSAFLVALELFLFQTLDFSTVLGRQFRVLVALLKSVFS